MPKKTAVTVTTQSLVKEENEIQTYINSFKEIEETETPSESKIYVEETEIGSSEQMEEGSVFCM